MCNTLNFVEILIKLKLTRLPNLPYLDFQPIFTLAANMQRELYFSHELVGASDSICRFYGSDLFKKMPKLNLTSLEYLLYL